MKAQMRQNGGANDYLVKATEGAWTNILRMANEDPRGWQNRIKNMFKRFDTDGSGDIDIEELGAGIQSLGVKLTRHELNAFASDIDDDGGGTIGLDEFITAVSQRLVMEGKAAPPPLTAAAREALHPDFAKRCSEAKALAWENVIVAASSDPRGWKTAVILHFEEFDSDKTGQMGARQFLTMLNHAYGVDLTPGQLEAFLKEISLNLNGIEADAGDDALIDREDFITAVGARLKAKAQPDPVLEGAWIKVRRTCGQ
jgi:Ca2+-binding EF-hand superfamily protein